jgi:uncharacterized protein
MEKQVVTLPGASPGASYNLAMLHFGARGASPKTYIQAGLHADEAPGMICAHHLRVRLVALEAEGKIRGHIVLVPAANPIGLSQQLMGSHHGRFALSDGVNFNRGFPDLTAEAGNAVAARLTQDGPQNVGLIRTALLEALALQKPLKLTDHLKAALLTEAIDADVVLDLHCDGEADMHLYTLTPQAGDFQPLADHLGATAMLLADISGDNPFDEAVSRPWAELAARYPDKPIPMGCIATTVELRGEADVSHDTAMADAEAIIRFLGARGQIDLPPQPAPAQSCVPTPLAGSEALEAPIAGLIVYRAAIGARLAAGDAVADIIDPMSGETVTVQASTSGVFFARAAARYVSAGRRIGKIAGTTPFRIGKLLSP